ncbi:hypothetical protein C823_004960 [Eubacterium plexicaudatum ASF492]|uniref:HTH cro/C1-type domain-containing protein n=1 Tax=Eubacterium plexicaudatum ASF492 TaxID=1235802 RepID=N1ZTJ2_9FIRM|nr:hypothetical protein C823_004960 [Eubacterium plexicaudatum ASF492]
MTNTENTALQMIAEAARCPDYGPDMVKALMKKLDMNEKGFALLMNVAPSTVRLWTSGAAQPSGTARRLMQIYETGPEIVGRIDAFSTEFHEAGWHLKNMGRSIQGKPAQAEAKENGRVADAFKGAFRIERAFASAIGENVGLSLNALARLEQRAQRRPSVLEAMREQAAKAAPAKHQPEASHDRGSR